MRSVPRGYGYASAVLIAVLLLPFIYAAFFNFPEGDDFASAIKASFPFDFIGGIGQMFSYWWKWSGRYSHAFALVFFGDACNSRIAYSAVILLSFFTLWLSVYGIAAELGEKGVKGQASFIATFWLFAVLCSYGTIHQWYSLVELVSLIAGYIFILVYIWSLCRLWNRPSPTRGTKWFAIIACVSAAGFYEHSAPLVMAISIGAWLLARLYDHPNRNVYFLLAKIALVCFFVVYLARGNFRRQTKLGMTFAMMLEQLLNVGKDWWQFVIPAYRNPIYIAALFVAVWLPPRRKTPLTDNIPAPIILCGCLVLCCVFSLGLAVVHAMSDVPIGQAVKIPMNIAQYSVVFIFFALYSCREWLSLHALRILGRPVCLVAVIAVLLGGTSNFFPVLWNGMFGETARYADAYEKRKTVMTEHAGQELAVMPLLGAPVPAGGDSLRVGYKSWPNKHAAPFYGLKGLESATPDPRSAYDAAAAREKIAWQSGPSFKLAYVPSLELNPDNATYRFDWLFIEAPGKKTVSLRVAAFGKCPVADSVVSSPAAMRKISEGTWPFRNIFKEQTVWPFEEAGRTLLAIPLPLLDSARSGSVDQLFVSVDGGSFLPVAR